MPHFLESVVEVKASGLRHVLKTVVVGKHGHASCNVFLLQ